MAKNENKLITYLVFFRNNIERKITVPASWKVTFGLLHPGSKGSYDAGNVLRFYEAKDKQRAVFTNVISFIDITSIKSEVKVVDSTKILEIRHDPGQTSQITEDTEKYIWMKEG